MTLPTSGPISLGQIADEFGVSRQSPFPSAFYGLGGAPTSGPLAFADFYGRSATPPSVFNPSGGTVADEEQGFASVTLSCNNPATWNYSGGGSGASANVASGGSATSITFSLSNPGKTTLRASFTVNATSNGVTTSYTVNLTADGSVGNQ